MHSDDGKLSRDTTKRLEARETLQLVGKAGEGQGSEQSRLTVVAFGDGASARFDGASKAERDGSTF